MNLRADHIYRTFLRLTRRLSNSQIMMLLAVVVGVLAGVGTYLFEMLLYGIKYGLTNWFPVDSAHILFLIYPAVGIIMACMLMPSALLTIPMYSIFHTLHLTNTMLSIIIPCCVSPFGFFLGRTYAQSSVPDELLEAARIDGASEARIFFTIVLRLLAPAMVTIFLFLFVATWNNFLLPLMMVSSDALKPVTLGLYGMVSLSTFTDRGALMMGALLGVLPVIVLFLGLQRYWQSGLAAGAVKG